MNDELTKLKKIANHLHVSKTGVSMNYQEGDVVQLERGHVVKIALPYQFAGYGIGNFEKLASQVVIIGDTYYYLDTSFLIGKWIITLIGKTAGGYGHGPGDYYPPVAICNLRSIKHENLKCSFYPFGEYGSYKNNPPIKVVGKAKATWNIE